MSSDNSNERIETHCTGCGELLRAKLKYAGKVLKCPKCRTPNQVPYAINDDGKVVASEAAPVFDEPEVSSGSFAGGIRPLDGGVSVATAVQFGRVPEIDNLLRSIYKCFEDAFDRGQAVLTDVALNRDRREAELVRARRDLTAAMRQALVGSLKSAQEKVTTLKNHPLAISGAAKTQLAEAEGALENFKMFAKCMFDLKVG